MIYFSYLILLFILLKWNIYTQNLSLNKENPKNPLIKGKKDIYSFQSRDNFSRMNNKNSILKENLSPLKKNLIIGVISKYNWNIIQPFFKSFENIGFKNCDCVIFISKISKDILKKIQSFGIIVNRIPQKYYDMNINKVRWKLYMDFIIDNLYKYNLVLAIDTRDSIFQQDIFKLYGSKKSFLGVGVEFYFP